MDNAEITQYIVDNLKNNRDENDIIMTICESTGMDWSQAEALMKDVRSENSIEIETPNNNRIIFLGSVFIFVGIALSVGMVMGTLQGMVIYLHRVPYLGNAFIFGTGVCMAIGGIVGIYKLFRPN
jgi:ABC-type xylose transport system permease subunit